MGLSLHAVRPRPCRTSLLCPQTRVHALCCVSWPSFQHVWPYWMVYGTHPIVQQYDHFGVLLGAHWWAQGLCLAASFPTCAHVCHLHCLRWMRLARREYEFFDRFDFWHQPNSCPRFHSSTSSLHVHMILILSVVDFSRRARDGTKAAW